MKQNWDIYRNGRKVAGFSGGIEAAIYVAPALRAYRADGPVRLRYKGRLVRTPEGLTPSVDSLMADANRIETEYRAAHGIVPLPR